MTVDAEVLGLAAASTRQPLKAGSLPDVAQGIDVMHLDWRPGRGSALNIFALTCQKPVSHIRFGQG